MMATRFEPIDYQRLYRTLGVDLGLNPIAVSETIGRDGPAYTFWRHGDILACAGLAVAWEGLATAWALVGPLAAQYPLVHRNIVYALEFFIKDLDLRRVECVVPVTSEMGHRWVRRLGFVEDGIASSYLPNGGDAMRYVRLRK